MAYKFKQKLIGPRLVLKRLKPDLKTAEFIFQTIDKNRQHLRQWLPWVDSTLKIEDSLKYLFTSEEKIKKGQKMGYGIFIDKKYAGNIGIHNIDQNNKSIEIGYWLDQAQTQQGYVSEAVNLLEKELFHNQNINRIVIKCDSRNQASAGVAKKCHYQLEGELRQDEYSQYFKDFRNTLVFAKLKSDFKKKKKQVV